MSKAKPFKYPPNEGDVDERINVRFNGISAKGGFGSINFGEHQGLTIELIDDSGQSKTVDKPVAVKIPLNHKGDSFLNSNWRAWTCVTIT